MQVPIINISPFLEPTSPNNAAARAEVASQWSAAFSTIGFASVVGHGVEPELFRAVQQASKVFFDLPMQQKQQSSFPGEKQSQGYYQVGVETVNKAFAKADGNAPPPDLVETLTFAFVDWEMDGTRSDFERSIFRANLWPDAPENLGALVRDYYARVRHIAQVLMEISAQALKLPADFFAPYYERIATSLRLAHYPEQVVEPEPGQLRYGAHTDYMGYTILLQDDAPGGLQVLDSDGTWIDAPPRAGAFTVNCGDLLSRWTNGRWKSNIHRVVNPPRSVTGSSRRISVVMFTGPDYEAEITCIPTCQSEAYPARYAPIRCWEHFQNKVRASLD
jgi:isopenicillin N synthase-like dioxygenase